MRLEVLKLEHWRQILAQGRSVDDVQPHAQGRYHPVHSHHHISIRTTEKKASLHSRSASMSRSSYIAYKSAVWAPHLEETGADTIDTLERLSRTGLTIGSLATVPHSDRPAEAEQVRAADVFSSIITKKILLSRFSAPTRLSDTTAWSTISWAWAPGRSLWLELHRDRNDTCVT